MRAAARPDFAGTLNTMSGAWKPALRKVCGVTRPEDARHAVQAGANAIGMVLYPPSPRAVPVARAERVVAAIPDGVRRVGVFVDEPPGAVAAAARQAGLDVVQLHGYEGGCDWDEMRSAVPDGVEIWKAVRVGPRFDAAGLTRFPADAYLLDTARAGLHGGTGEAFPWHLAARARPYGRVIVAGGLDGGNAAEAARIARPWGVDASSRLESRPGVKDPAKVTAYLRAVG